MISKHHIGLIGFIAVILVSACNPTKRLKEGEVFLRKQKLIIEDPPKGFNLESDEMKAVFRQKTNRKIFGTIRFNLGAYNMVSENRIEKAHQRKQAKLDRKNTRRERKGKDPIEKKIRTKWDWLKYTVGEAPVIYDTSLTKKTVSQLGVFLAKNGYFDNSVKFKEFPNKSGKKIAVNYIIKPNDPYRIRNISFTSEDEEILRRSEFLTQLSLLKPKQIFRVDLLNRERERITKMLNNRGYYAFSKDYIQFEVDSTIGDRKVDINLHVKAPKIESPITPDSLISIQHKRYFINEIFIHTTYEPTAIGYQEKDTIVYKDIVILYNEKLEFKPEILSYTNIINKETLYKKDDVDQTYRRLNDLGVFKSLSIRFESKEISDNRNSLDCHIYVSSAKKQGISSEATGTHRSGILGISGNVGYKHKNVFRGAESFDGRINIGVEAQPPLTQTDSDEITSAENVQRRLNLNTFEIGPEFTLYLHKLFPFNLDKLARSTNPGTIISTNFNYQSRPDYERTLSKFRFGYRFREGQYKTHLLDLIDFSIIKIDKSNAFQERLDSLNDDFLNTSYSDHLISATGYTFIYNSQELKFQREYFLNRISGEVAGNLLRFASNTSGRPVDENGDYELFNIRFAQYFKVENDFRFYHNFDQSSSIVFRADVGVGVPFNNLNVLPFEKSFFGGGSNGIRAWQAWTLGPGSFRDSTAAVTYNNIGEFKLELNAEYRFDLTKSLEGALFIDVGNIWLLEEDKLRVGSGIESKTFLSEIAVGSGMGLRLDFEYFLIRFDGGIQLKDPAKIPGERWIWEPKDEYNSFLEYLNSNTSNTYRPRITFNLGIGYPF